MNQPASPIFLKFAYYQEKIEDKLVIKARINIIMNLLFYFLKKLKIVFFIKKGVFVNR